MDDHVLTALEDLRYDGPLVNEELFAKEIEEAKSIKFTGLVAWLSTQIKSLCNMEDHVNAITDLDDWNTFLLELSGFLKEMQCPLTVLTEGPVSQRLVSKENRLLLLGFLCDELEAARMIKVLRPDSGALQVQMDESPVAKAMKGMLITLGFGKPPPNITPAQLFSKAESKVRELVPEGRPRGHEQAAVCGRPHGEAVVRAGQAAGADAGRVPRATGDAHQASRRHHPVLPLGRAPQGHGGQNHDGIPAEAKTHGDRAQCQRGSRACCSGRPDDAGENERHGRAQEHQERREPGADWDGARPGRTSRGAAAASSRDAQLAEAFRRTAGRSRRRNELLDWPCSKCWLG
ncbi:hypothetical protein MRX96_031482 [Rhipicephalus microplus]